MMSAYFILKRDDVSLFQFIQFLPLLYLFHLIQNELKWVCWLFISYS